MKKIVSALFLAFAGIGFVFAQNLQVSVNGQAVADGETVTLNGGLDMKAQFQLTNNTEADMSIVARVDDSSLPEGCSILLCGFGTCFVGNTTQPATLAAGDTYGDVAEEDFHLEYIADAEGKNWTAPVTIADETSGLEFHLTIVYQPTAEQPVSEGLVVAVNGESVSDGGTITLSGGLDIKAQFQLTNNTEADMSIVARVDDSSLPEGCSFLLCGFGTCFVGNTTQPATLAAGDTYGDVAEEDFHLEYIADVEGKNWTAPVMIADETSGLEFHLTIEYIAGNVANEDLNRVEIAAYPNPAAEEVVFNLGNVNVGAKLVLRDMSGRTVKMVDAEAEVSMDLEGLSSGVYFYSLEENGKAVVTRKLVVR